MRKSLLLMSLLLPLAANAIEVTIDGIFYRLGCRYEGNQKIYNASVISKGISNPYYGDIVIPETITYEGTPYFVEEIAFQAFINCSALTSITLPNSMRFIARQSFWGCYGLNSIFIPKKVEAIDAEAFCGCYNLTSIVVDPDNIHYDSRDNCNAVINSENNCLELGCQNTIIPSNVTSIGTEAFRSQIKLTSITIPQNVSKIGNSAFWGAGLTSISIPSNVTDIEYGAFSSTFNLKDIYCYSENVPTTNPYAFSNWDRISLHIPYVSNDKYKSDPAWKNFKYGDPLMSIDRIIYCISDNSQQAVLFDGKYTDISDYSIPSSITNNDISYSVTSIGEKAFWGYSSLTRVVIPNSVVNIGEAAFEGCDNLISVVVNNKTPISINANTFTNRENATLFVPKGSISKYKTANYWKDFKSIEEIKLPTHTLTYLVDGAEYKSYEIEEEETITPEAEPEKEGYTFSGWSEIPETMPAHDVTITGTFNINSYKLTYMLDNEVYKEVTYEYGATITPEPTPEGNYASFEWEGLPETMPAKDVVVHARYETTGIINVTMKSGNNRIYSISGKQLDKPQHGLNIINVNDGTTKKVVVK